MANVARIGDVGTGTCCCHTLPPCIGVSGSIVSGAGTVMAEGSPVARIGDIIVAGCGHTGTIVSGSGTVISEGSPTSRIGDTFAGCFTGVIVTGASTVLAS